MLSTLSGLSALWAYFKAEEGLGPQGFPPGETAPLLERQSGRKEQASLGARSGLDAGMSFGSCTP